MGDHEISDEFYKRLERDLDKFQSEMVGTMDEYNKCLRQYTQLMENELQNGTFLNEYQFSDLHTETRTKSVSQVWKHES